MKKLNWKELNVLEDGCGGVIYKILNIDDSGLKNMEVAMCVFSPAEVADLHYHDIMEEIYFIIEGDGEIEMDGVWYKISAEDSISIPIGTKHRIRNTSNENFLRFLSVNSPSWREDDMKIIK